MEVSADQMRTWRAVDSARLAQGYEAAKLFADPESGELVVQGTPIETAMGAGLLLTTEECLLSPVQERNPGLSRADYEKVFADYLGIRKVLWLHGR